MLTSAFILIIAFASADMVYTISVCKKDHILHFFLIRIVFWNKQKILLLVFFPMFNALLFEYKCLWGLIRSEMCDTECNITAVAIAWLVWNWDKMPARISFTKQFECDSVRELARIYWIFSRMWKKNTN